MIVEGYKKHKLDLCCHQSVIGSSQGKMKWTPLLVPVFLVCWTVVMAGKHVHFKIHVPVIKKEIHHEKIIFKHIDKHNHKESHYDHHHEDGGFGGDYGGGHHEGYDEGGQEDHYGGYDQGHVEYPVEGGHGWDED